MKKILVWFLTLFVSFISVSSSCFFYPESPTYCTSLSADRAERECALYEDCGFGNVYDAAACSEIPACEKELCKSSCEEEFRGKCAAGIIPAAEKERWCATGCCYVRENCDYVPSQWECEVFADNADAQYDFKPGDEQDCQTLCARKGILKTPAETVVPLENLSVPGVIEEVSEKQSWWWLLPAILILAALIYYLAQKYPAHGKAAVKSKAPL